MTEAIQDKGFDIEKFKTEVSLAVKIFARSAYTQERETAELYEALLDKCAVALLDATDKKAVEEVIHRNVAMYRYGNGMHLFFGNNDHVEFWKNITMKVVNLTSERIVKKETEDGTVEGGVVQTAQAAHNALIDIEHMAEGDKRSLLEIILFQGDVAQLEALIDRGFDVDQTDYVGRSALQVAAFDGMRDMLEMLLRRGANVNFIFAPTKLGGGKSTLTAIDAAEEKGHTAIVELLRANGGKKGSEL